MDISPVYRMKLLEKVEKEIWNTFKSYEKVDQYVKMNQEVYDGFGHADFDISYFTDGNKKDKINLAKTLENITIDIPDKLIKIAIDLGLETPDFIPSIPTFRNKLKADYKNASVSFEDPAESVGYANSVLESIMKEILKDSRFSDINASNLTNGKLVKAILKKFGLDPSLGMPDEMKSIGSSLTTVSKAIEDLRSDKTLFHGQNSDKYLIGQPLYAYFAVNACVTVGLFWINFYENKFLKFEVVQDESLPF